MPLETYPIFLIVAVIALYLFGGKTQIVENPSPVILSNRSPFRYSVFIKSNGQVFRSYEDNDICKLGYLIFTMLSRPNFKNEVYILNNPKNELMRIDKDYDSECMIGVDHPEHGHIGYLPFSVVTSIL